MLHYNISNNQNNLYIILKIRNATMISHNQFDEIKIKNIKRLTQITK